MGRKRKDAKKKKRNMSMMWIDYKKAYDSIPHSWLIDAMEVYKIDEITINFIQTLMPAWRTKIHLPHDDDCISTDDINIERGFFKETHSPPYSSAYASYLSPTSSNALK